MRQLYNSGRLEHLFWKNSPKTAVLLATLTMMIVVPGCRKTSGEVVVTPPVIVSADVVGQADEFYAGRSDVMKVRQALVALRQAQTDSPTNYEIAWRVARSNYYLGAHTTDETEKEKAFHDGVEAGKLAVKLNNDRVEGHFWLGANYGGNAEISTLAGLTDIDNIKREMEAVLKIDEHFEGGSAYLGLGQMYLKAPKIFGGDVGKAIDYLEKGVKVGPNNGLMHLRLAQAYAEANRDNDARAQLKTLFENKPTPGYEPEYNDAVKEGRELEAKLKQ
jgi:tetratricopeptide (TPR) repeat protein